MPQKIFDIIPVEEKKEIIKKENKKSSRNIRKYIFYFFLFFFLFSGFWAYSSFSTVEIEIWANTEKVTFEEEIVISETDYIDIVERIVPGKIFSVNVKEEGTFFASGKDIAEERAKGIIRVYNKHSTEDQTIVAQTRFVSSDGKLFRTIRANVIPGGSFVGGKLEPGHIDVEVVAAEAGEEYNIKPTLFSIPGFAGTDRFHNFYGESLSDMRGGFKGEAPVIKEEDIVKAKESVREELFNKGYQKALANTEGLVLPGDIFLRKEIVEEKSSNSAGEFVSEFKYEIEADFYFLGFRENDINVLAENIITENIEDKKIKEGTIEISYEILSRDEDFLKLNVSYNAYVHPEIIISQLKEEIKGKERDDVRKFLIENPKIGRVQINSWPLLRNRAPNSLEKINLLLNI